MLTVEPSEGSYTNDIVTAAHALLPAGLDISGEGFARSRRRTSSRKKAAPDLVI